MLDLYLENIDRYIELSVTTTEQTLERCPNLALATAFFAPGTKGSPTETKGPCPTVVRGAGIFSPGWYYQPGLKLLVLVWVMPRE